ncbi:MAG: glycerophosphodiester phosphodiesterase family protein [Cyclobacteriaceae bacterium]
MKNSLIILLALIMSCALSKEQKGQKPFDLQGHRGARGLMPENSIPGFFKAIELGVTTLELDLCVTKDNKLVLSHEPIMSSMICTNPQGKAYDDSVAHNYNIYQLTYEEVKSFDCGSLPHPWFPEQMKMATYKPLLTDVFDTVNFYLANNKSLQKAINYNIEIKTQATTDGVYHPTPKEFSDLVFNTINDNLDWKYITIQSFDFRVLQYWNQTYPEVKLTLLIENKLSPKENLDSLGFIPEVYSCEHILLSRTTIDQLHKKGMHVIPWTVNDAARMDTLQSWNVDGLITDYPNRF